MFVISNKFPTEFMFGVDEFNDPKTKSGPEAICTLLIRLALLEPGTIQSHPEAGLGIRSKYRYSEVGTAGQLQSDFQGQIEKYYPQFKGVKVKVTEKGKAFIISVEINKVLYALSIDTETMHMNNTYKQLSEL